MIKITFSVLATASLINACGGGGGSATQATPPVASFCSQQAFVAPVSSRYFLPWNVSACYSMFQGNCSSLGGHIDTFAYDFDLAMGDPILASRGGVVIVSNDNYSDDDHIEGHENNVFVEHDGGTVIRYTHLMQGGAAVIVGQVVTQGEFLGMAGNSGNSAGPHLHFQAFRDRNSFNKDNAIPIAFRNAIGQMATSGELLEGQSYEAGM